jgi:hypothetical protein
MEFNSSVLPVDVFERLAELRTKPLIQNKVCPILDTEKIPCSLPKEQVPSVPPSVESQATHGVVPPLVEQNHIVVPHEVILINNNDPPKGDPLSSPSAVQDDPTRDDCSRVQYNYCPQCFLPMTVINSCEYRCTKCGLCLPYEACEAPDRDSIIFSDITMSSGHFGHSDHYYGTSSRSNTQHLAVLQHLCYNAKDYLGQGPSFPLDVLREAADQFHEWQKNVKEAIVDESGQVIGERKFVKRNSRKDEILATLIYSVGIKYNQARKEKDVAELMKLKTHGFSRGKSIISNLASRGKLELPDMTESSRGYICRYMGTLGIDEKYYDFVDDLVKRSDEQSIGMYSQIASKVAGAIWILSQNCGLGISAKAIEKATDGTRKNTFTKFCKAIMSNLAKFADIFTKYGVPLDSVAI